MGKKTLAVVLLLTSQVAADAQQIDTAALPRTASGEATTTLDKVRAVTAWANASFKWTYTDYRERSVDEIIARRGGNCFEQRIVVAALLDELGIRSRSMREISIQPASRLRRWSRALHTI